MCNRLSQILPHEAMAALFGIHLESNLEPLYNAAPTDEILIVRGTGGSREALPVRWGLVPRWVRTEEEFRAKFKAPMTNARDDKVLSRPSFRDAFVKRRCLVPADGFYEWQSTPAGKQGYRFTLPGGELFAFAGLWESSEALGITSCTIMTSGANDIVRRIHPANRMGAILNPEDYEAWLDMEAPVETLLTLLRPYEGKLIAYPVTKEMNNARFKGAGCIERIGPDLEEPAKTVL